MSGAPEEAAILFADIAGSVPLYERAGDSQALRLVAQCLDALADTVRGAGGLVVRSKGDDLLATFAAADAALAAARHMLEAHAALPLDFRLGLHFGPILRARGDVFGDAVNLAARVLALADRGEALLTDALFERLADSARDDLRPLGTRVLRGKSTPTGLYLLAPAASAAGAPTVMTAPSPGTGAPAVRLRLRHRGRVWTCAEGRSLVLGRAGECDLRLEHPWVSRRHATLAVAEGKAVLHDASSWGTYVAPEHGPEVAVRRESVTLLGRGSISLGKPVAKAGSDSLGYEVTG